MSCQPIIAARQELLSDSFPYVLWPLKPLVYHLQTLPATIDRQLLREWLSYLSRALQRNCALVLGPADCVYFTSDGTHRWSAEPPKGGYAFKTDVAIAEPPYADGIGKLAERSRTGEAHLGHSCPVDVRVSRGAVG